MQGLRLFSFYRTEYQYNHLGKQFGKVRILYTGVHPAYSQSMRAFLYTSMSLILTTR